jgi:hypothetical protein
LNPALTHLTHYCPPRLPAGVKLSVFDGAKKLLTRAELAYDEECRLAGVPPPVRQEWRAPARGAKNEGTAAATGKQQQQPPRK